MQTVKMYTTAVCPYCIRAKQLRSARGVAAIEGGDRDVRTGLERRDELGLRRTSSSDERCPQRARATRESGSTLVGANATRRRPCKSHSLMSIPGL